MTQFYAVLRRSMAHLPADDPEARARAFASAREAMVRLLWSYDPPLTSAEIADRLGDFDSAVDRIEVEIASGPLEPAAAESGSEPESASEPAAPADAAPEGSPAAPPAWHDDPAPFETATAWRDDDDAPDRFAAASDDGWAQDATEEADDEDDGDARGAARPQPPRAAAAAAGTGLVARLRGDVAAVSPSTLLAGLGAALVILALVGCVWFVSSLIERAGAPDLADPNALPALPEEEQAEKPPPKPTVQELVDDNATQVSVAAVDAPAGDAPEGTIVLFDGRDPTVFQSAPANPVRFEGGPDQGFVRISTSTSSTGTRLNVGRGAFERLAGQTIRLIVVARGSPDRPSGSFRFTYQNGRTVGPWIIGRPDAEWQTFSATWAVPPDRGNGPENDLLLIEPGVPGDGTAIDVRSVRIEIIGKTPEDDPVTPPAETNVPTDTPL